MECKLIYFDFYNLMIENKICLNVKIRYWQRCEYIICAHIIVKIKSFYDILNQILHFF